jgi:hypothetical protein
MPVTPDAGVKFTSATARAAARNSNRSRPGPQLRKLLDAQEAAWNAAINNETPVKFRASLMRAYHDLTRLVMDWQGIGKPANVTARNDPDAKSRSKPKFWSVEPIELDK